jgi:hypothetical protein
MTTRIVFGGGAEIEVPLPVDQVRTALQQQAQGERLSELELAQRDRNGNPIRIYVNRDLVAFITDAEPTERPVAEATRQPVTDLWGNPIRPRRRKR